MFPEHGVYWWQRGGGGGEDDELGRGAGLSCSWASRCGMRKELSCIRRYWYVLGFKEWKEEKSLEPRVEVRESWSEDEVWLMHASTCRVCVCQEGRLGGRLCGGRIVEEWKRAADAVRPRRVGLNR